MKTSSRGSTLATLFPSLAMARLVVFFLVHPGESFHLRELQRRTGLSSASIQKELASLTRIGALQRERSGRRTVLRADEQHPAWYAWMLLIRAAADPVDVLREALVDAAVDAAFVFGSVARGDATAESDLDVLLVGEPEQQRRAVRLLGEAELITPRYLDVVAVERDTLSARARTTNGFARRVMDEPKRWLRGGPEVFDARSA